MRRRALITVTCILVLASVCPAGYKPIHEPLNCMKRFRFREFAVIGWSFHKKGGGDYNEQFMKVAKDAGFNVMLDVGRMLEPTRKTGMNVLIAAMWYDVPKLEKLAATTMKHPAAIGYDLWDNCTSVPRPTLQCSQWMLKNCPHLIAYFAENPNVKAQSRTPLRVISTQNYAFGYNNTGPDDDKRRNYCNSLSYDSVCANRYDMTFWPIFASLANHTVGDSEIRFQTYAAVAYGAQGVVSFAYSVNRPQWDPKTGSVYKASGWTNRYIQDVVGRHVMGCRSIGVFHTPNLNDMPRGAEKPGPGKLIEKMDPALLAGVLAIEKDFKSKKNTPAYVMVVDKRTVRDNRRMPKQRGARIYFGPQVQTVEVLRRKTGIAADDKLRLILPAWIVPVTLEAGDGLLLRMNPPGLEGVLGKDARMAYTGLVKDYGALWRQIQAGKLTVGALERAAHPLATRLHRLDRLVEAKGDRNATATLDNLLGGVGGFISEAHGPRFVHNGRIFLKTCKIQLKTLLKGVDIRYTLDGHVPTAKSRKYTGPITLDKTVTVKAVAVGGKPRGLMGPVAAAQFTKVNGKIAAPLTINFQPRGVPVPKGALPDYGAVFGAREGQRGYGWSIDRTNGCRHRRRSRDPLKATQIRFIPGAVWELMVDNATYDVTVCIGDADYATTMGSIWVEDVEYCNAVGLARGQFHQTTKTVTVKDGKLTIRSHNRGRRDRCTRINFVEIKKK